MEILIIIAVVVGAFVWLFRRELKKAGEGLPPLSAGEAMNARGRTHANSVDILGVVGSTTVYIDAADLEEDLEAAFTRYRSGEITLDDYAGVIEGYTKSLRQKIATAESQEELEETADALEALRWRAEWIEKKRWSAEIDVTDIADSGKWARFSYCDADGAETQREIANWEKRGAYIVGYDRQKKGERTFRQDRIGAWQAG